MDDKNREFPQYRKLSNGLRFYRILDDKTFEEIQLMGSKIYRFTHKAKQYPELVMIMDMLSCENHYHTSTVDEWNALSPAQNN